MDIEVSASKKDGDSQNDGFGVFESQADSMDVTGPNSVRVKKYVQLVDRIVRREGKVVDVWVEEVEQWSTARRLSVNLAPEEIAELVSLPSKMEDNTLRYKSLLEEVLDEMVKEARANDRALRGLPQDTQDEDDPTTEPEKAPAASQKPVQALLRRQ